MSADTRRTFVRSGLALSALAVSPLASALDAGVQPHFPAGIGTQPDFDGPLPAGSLGTDKPLPPEEAVAQEILARSPQGPRPLDVAKYFLDVSNGKYGAQWRLYTFGWPQRWNPLIVTFFNATRTTPMGDLTPWCAAFVNWCFLRAVGSGATHDASSGSFRCFGTSDSPPKEGDVVVFRRIGDTTQCGGHGHVGFYLAQRKDAVQVLGGNQIEGQDRSHCISVKWLSKRGTLLEFHSYRGATQVARIGEL